MNINEEILNTIEPESENSIDSNRVWPRRRILDRENQLNFEQAIEAMMESENVEDWNWRREAIVRNYYDESKVNGKQRNSVFFLGWIDGTGLIVRVLGEDAPESIPDFYRRPKPAYVAQQPAKKVITLKKRD